MSSAANSREVITVRGLIRPDEMGITYTHEHLFLDAMDHYPGYGYQLVIDDEEVMAKEIQEFTSRGGRTICDVTLDEIGRDPQRLVRFSKQTGIHVLMGCGWYRDFGYPPIVAEMTSRELADVLVQEIEVGVGDTGIRAGFIGEIGTGRHFIKPAEERVFRASALAQARTDVVITTHTTRWGTLAMEQIALLEEFGADLSRVIIGHLGDRVGVKNLLPIAEKGVYLEIDNIGYLDYQPEWVRADNAAELVKAGFVDQVLLSEDICMLNHLKYTGGKGYGYILEVFVPLLRERGITDEQIHQMMVVNPARAFSGDVLMLSELSERFGIRPIINCVGHATRVSGSCPHPEVIAAINVASTNYWEIDDLLSAASALIQLRTETEAGIVTSGASAALTLAAAACLAGNRPEIMDQLPDVSGCSRSEIIYPHPGPYDYDHAIRLSGAKLVPIDYRSADALQRIENAITPRTAAIGYVWLQVEERPDLATLAELSHRHGLPLIVDAACALPPVENLTSFSRLGADLIAYSGGKHLGGPQASGILCGREELIRSAWVQMVDMDVRSGTWSLQHWVEEGWISRSPRHGIGRSMKVSKEGIVGLMAALDRYARRDHAAEYVTWNASLQAIHAGLRNLPELRLTPRDVGLNGQPFPVLVIESGLPPEGMSARDLVLALRARPRKIVLSEDEQSPDRAFLYTQCLQPGDVEEIVSAVRHAVLSHRDRISR